MSVTFNRTSERVQRISEGKRGVNVTESRAYVVYTFTSATAANAAAAFLTKRVKADAEASDVLKAAAMDPREFLHVSEAAQKVAEAQLRAIGSRPTGKFVADSLEEWNGRGYIAIDNVVVTVAARSLPTMRAIETAARKNAEAVPAELVDTAHRHHAAAVEARSAARALRSPVTKTIAA